MGKDAVMVIRAILFSLAITAGNFAYQAFGPENWYLAFERSFLQWWAIVGFAAGEHFIWRKQ